VMKAALNGVPSPSVLHGWWVDGCIEGITGGPSAPKATRRKPMARRRSISWRAPYCPYFIPILTARAMKGAIGKGRCRLHLPSHNAPL